MPFPPFSLGVMWWGAGRRLCRDVSDPQALCGNWGLIELGEAASELALFGPWWIRALRSEPGMCHARSAHRASPPLGRVVRLERAGVGFARRFGPRIRN